MPHLVMTLKHDDEDITFMALTQISAAMTSLSFVLNEYTHAQNFGFNQKLEQANSSNSYQN